MSTRVANTVSLPDTSFIAGSVLPIQRAEELLATLPGVISARIVASASGSVDEIHILTTDDVTPKQTVRNVESALIAHLGMRVSHKKISVATSSEGREGRAYTPQPTPPKGNEVIPPVAPEKTERASASWSRSGPPRRTALGPTSPSPSRNPRLTNRPGWPSRSSPWPSARPGT